MEICTSRSIGMSKGDVFVLYSLSYFKSVGSPYKTNLLRNDLVDKHVHHTKIFKINENLIPKFVSFLQLVANVQISKFEL